MKVAVLISGRGSNLHAILQAEAENRLGEAEVVLVLSNKPDALGLNYAKEYGKKTEIIEAKEYETREEYDKAVVKVLKEYEVELVVLAGFMRILSPYFVQAYKHRIINIHPALLPSFPGLHAQKQALDYGVKISGCTVHFVDEEVDHGAIILQEAVRVLDDDSEETLSQRILEKEHELFPLAIKFISEGKIEIKGRKVRIVN
ncbi:MAG: phosphoribosylglycinamide formyltransferase [Candidatus Heimdallarchaeaceae archaeon]